MDLEFLDVFLWPLSLVKSVGGRGPVSMVPFMSLGPENVMKGKAASYPRREEDLLRFGQRRPLAELGKFSGFGLGFHIERPFPQGL